MEKRPTGGRGSLSPSKDKAYLPFKRAAECEVRTFKSVEGYDQAFGLLLSADLGDFYVSPTGMKASIIKNDYEDKN